MPTKLSVINTALNLLGRDDVADLNIRDSGLRTLASLYDKLKPLALESFPWSFAKRTALLVQDTNPPEDPVYKYAFHLPSDYIQLWKGSSNGAIARPNYEIVYNNLVYTNHPAPWNWTYVADVEAEHFTQSFAMYLGYYLAFTACMQITKDQNLKKDLQTDMMMQKGIAQNRDYTAQSAWKIQSNPITNSRYR